MCSNCYTDAKERKPTCRNAHVLKEYIRPASGGGCNSCDGGCGRKGIAYPEQLYRCHECNFDMCNNCYTAAKECKPTCRNVHVLKEYVPPASGGYGGVNSCNGGCGRQGIAHPEQLYRCHECNFDMCSNCYDSATVMSGRF